MSKISPPVMANGAEAAKEALKELAEHVASKKPTTLEEPMTAYEWAESIRVVHCMSRKDFDRAFGKEDGGPLWSKYTIYFDAREADFICYLDLSNQKKLFKYCLQKMRGLL